MSSYIGTQASYGLFEKQVITILPGTSVYSLHHRVAGAASLLVVCNRLILEPREDYTITHSGTTSSIQFLVDLSSGFDGDTTVYVVYLGKELNVPTTQAIIDDLYDEKSARINGDSSTLANAKSYADQKISDLVAGSPELLNTLKELSDALGSDENFSTTVATQIASVNTQIDAEELARIGADAELEVRVAAAEVNISTKVSSSSLAAVAFSGSYNDLLNKPTNFLEYLRVDGSRSMQGDLNVPAPHNIFVGGDTESPSGLNTKIYADRVELRQNNGSGQPLKKLIMCGDFINHAVNSIAGTSQIDISANDGVRWYSNINTPGTPYAPEHLTTKAYVDSVVVGGNPLDFLKVDGSVPMTGNLNLNYNSILIGQTNTTQEGTGLLLNNSGLTLHSKTVFPGPPGMETSDRLKVYIDPGYVTLTQYDTNNTPISIISLSHAQGPTWTGTPTTNHHLTTKEYVDQQLAAAQSSITFLLNKVAELESRIEALENPTAGI